MRLLLSLPGGSEWIVLGLFGIIFLLVIPIKALLLSSKNKDLKKQLVQVEEEKNILLKKLLDKV